MNEEEKKDDSFDKCCDSFSAFGYLVLHIWNYQDGDFIYFDGTISSIVYD